MSHYQAKIIELDKFHCNEQDCQSMAVSECHKWFNNKWHSKKLCMSHSLQFLEEWNQVLALPKIGADTQLKKLSESKKWNRSALAPTPESEEKPRNKEAVKPHSVPQNRASLESGKA